MNTHRYQCIVFFLVLCIIQPFLQSESGSCNSRISCSSRSISDDCGNGCSGDCTLSPCGLETCSTGVCCLGKGCSTQSCSDCTQVTTFLRPRPILTDLTYRNNMSFYQRYHDACCSFFSYDATWLYQRNRKAACLGLGFFGKQLVTVAEEGAADIASLNLSLGSTQPTGYFSTFTFRPKRSVLGWMPQFTFNLDCLCTGLWADIAFAVLSVHHEFCLNEKVTTPGEINDITNAQQAFNALDTFARSRRHTGVDDIEVRLGYDWLYCDNDHVGVYLDGIIPTGREFDNTRFFQPLVGSRNGAIGFGLTADNTWWDDEIAQTACVIMTELKYLHKFGNKERRIFDLTNGPLSRFLLVVQEDERFEPVSATTLLRQCVHVECRSLLEWWLSIHYQKCNWGFEAAYNLFYRDSERVQPRSFHFCDYGIFDMTRCGGLTSHSDAKISDQFGEGTADEEFVKLKSTDVNLASGRAQKAVSHTLSGSISYNNFWRCYPWSFGVSASYEFASKKHRRSTLENWGVFAKWTMSV